jgi:hypothetical protein
VKESSSRDVGSNMSMADEVHTSFSWVFDGL